MADPILESSLKTTLNTVCFDIFFVAKKCVDKFQLCLKTAASLFPFSCMTFLIISIDVAVIVTVTVAVAITTGIAGTIMFLSLSLSLLPSLFLWL
jgi:hypothetical protein